MKYTITAVPNFGGFGSNANAINEEGTVVGDASGGTYVHAARLKNNNLKDLTLNQGTSTSEAYDINNIGKEQIVGEFKAGNTTHAFLWQEEVLIDLNEELGSTWSIAMGINDSGLIVGTRGGSSAEAYLYNSNTQQVINPFPNAYIAFGHAVNANGHMVGRAYDLPQGFVYDGSPNFLPTLGGNATDPTDINDIGLIVGASMTADGDWHAFVHDSNGIHDINDPTAIYSKAWGINNNNVIVGKVTYQSGIEAFIREPGKNMEILRSKITNIAGWTELWRAYDINDEGQICGTGVFNGERHGFVLTPVKTDIRDKIEMDLPTLVAEILFGVGTGGGGVIVVGGKIIPIDPPRPYKELIRLNQRALGDLMVQGLMSHNAKRLDIETLIREVYNQSVENHKAFFKGKLK
ncbi:hypothetical protein [Allomuricauda sp. d1]|uniref:hypothetical protein n=1 Tax=Allomuricauda sp. d1 TaxID=3136725 RepID=UPI0031E392C6